MTGRDRSRSGVYRIDPRRNRVTSFIRLPPTPVVVTVAYDRVWVDEPRAGPAVVFRIDPRTNRISGRPIRVGTGGGWMVAGFGALWVTNGDSSGSVSRINPATGTVTRTLVNIPDVTAAGAGSLWGTGNSRRGPPRGSRDWQGDRNHPLAEERRTCHLLGRLGLGIGRTARHAHPCRPRVEPDHRRGDPGRDIAHLHHWRPEWAVGGRLHRRGPPAPRPHFWPLSNAQPGHG